MTNDALSVLDCLFQTIWSLFTTWHIPGTNVTPAGFFLFLISASIGFRYVLSFLHSPSSGYGQAVSFSARFGFNRGSRSSGVPDVKR